MEPPLIGVDGEEIACLFEPVFLSRVCVGGGGGGGAGTGVTSIQRNHYKNVSALMKEEYHTHL